MNPYKKIKELEEYIEVMNKDKKISDIEIQQLKKDLENPKKVIEAVMGRETKWIDYENLPENKQKEYFASIESMKMNVAFRSLFGYEDEHGERCNGQIVKDFIEGSVESQDFQQMRDIQMSINGVEMVWTNINSIIDPDINKKTGSNNEE